MATWDCLDPHLGGDENRCTLDWACTSSPTLVRSVTPGPATIVG
jgi:hypothetical protein